MSDLKEGTRQISDHVVDWFDRQDYMRFKSSKNGALSKTLTYMSAFEYEEWNRYVRDIIVLYFETRFDESFRELAEDSKLMIMRENTAYLYPLLYQYMTKRCVFIYQWANGNFMYTGEMYTYFMHKLCEIPKSVVKFFSEHNILGTLSVCQPRFMLIHMYRSQKTNMKELYAKYVEFLKVFVFMTIRLIGRRVIATFRGMWEEYKSTGPFLRRRDKLCSLHKVLLLEVFRRLQTNESGNITYVRRLMEHYNNFYWYKIDSDVFKSTFCGNEANVNEDKCSNHGVNFDIANKILGEERKDTHWFFDLNDRENKSSDVLTLYNGLKYHKPFILSKTEQRDRFFTLIKIPNQEVQINQIVLEMTQ